MDHSMETARQREFVVQVMSLICSVGVTPKVTRRASPVERTTLTELQGALREHFTDSNEQHVRLLERLWAAFFQDDPRPFQRTSPLWTLIGFQNSDPASDIRGGGRLSLECLCFLLEQHRPLALKLFHRRAQRERARPNSYANYPFACGGIAVCRKLCELLLMVQPLSGKATDEFETAELPFWQVAQSKTTFLELFACTFALLDSIWHEQDATYMQFQQIMNTAKDRMLNVLSRLPAGVVPSAHSFNFPTGDPALDYPHPDERGPTLLSFLVHDVDDRALLTSRADPDNDSPTTPHADQPQPTILVDNNHRPLAPANNHRPLATQPAKPTAVEGDLLDFSGLGLDEATVTAAFDPTPAAYTVSYKHSQGHTVPGSDVDFFSSFGLDE